MNKLWIALAAAVLFFGATPASADSVSNTFVGTVAGDAGTTNDLGGYFGGGSLVGDTFTLTLTMDPLLVSGQTFVTGGTFYFGPNPITAALTINSVTQIINDSSDAAYTDLGNGTIDAYLQAFNWLNQVQSPGLFVDLATNVPAVADLGTPLPTMLLSNGDFVNNGASFYDGASGENLDLNVKAVNVEAVNVPEPGSLMLLAAGLTVLALILRRQAGLN